MARDLCRSRCRAERQRLGKQQWCCPLTNLDWQCTIRFMGMYRWRGGGRFWEPPVPLSVLQLVKYGTLDLRLAGLLWLIMECRASVLVAAGPSSAGKTTTLNVLLDFLPPSVKQVHIRGYGEDFRFLETAKPDETYLVAEEFSDYGDYVWGEVAQRAFDLLSQGYSLGGTIHARNAEEVLYVLNEYLGLSASVLGNVGMIVTIRAWRGRTEPVRQIDGVTLIMPAKDAVSLHTIASREMGSDAFVFADEKALQRILSGKFHLVDINITAEVEKRQQFLGQLLRDGRVFRDQVREAVVDFYNGGRS